MATLLAAKEEDEQKFDNVNVCSGNEQPFEKYEHHHEEQKLSPENSKNKEEEDKYTHKGK